MNATLRQAISDSIRENRIVSIEHDGDIDSCIGQLGDEWDGDIDYARENDGSYDVWGWNDETPPNEQNWRLNVLVQVSDN